MTKEQYLERLKNYNKTLSNTTLLEKGIVQYVNKMTHLYELGLAHDKSVGISDIETFIKEKREFKGLLKTNSGKLCTYLRNIMKYTYTSGYIRISARSKHVENYEGKIYAAICSFYFFYGMNLKVKDLVYGEYRDLNMDFSSIIAAEILENNSEVIEYCKEVITSENNVGILTRDVIKAIEKANNEELMDLLENLLLAAKHQEGLRQSIIETIDEHDVNNYLRMLKVIQRENLIRFVSVQRGVMTWIGLGYQEVEEKEVRFLFDNLVMFLNSEEERKIGLLSDNPLLVYLALFCNGITDVGASLKEARSLLKSKKHKVDGILMYLNLSRAFDITKNLELLDRYKDDKNTIIAILSCGTYTVFNKSKLPEENADYLMDYLSNYISTMKSVEKAKSKGFAWVNMSISKYNIVQMMFSITSLYGKKEHIDMLVPYTSEMYQGQRKKFVDGYFHKASRDTRVAFFINGVSSNEESVHKLILEKIAKESLTEEEIEKLEKKLTTKKVKSKEVILKILAKQDTTVVKRVYERLSSSSDYHLQEAGKELGKLKRIDTEKEDTTIKYDYKNGFGLFKPKEEVRLSYTDSLSVKKSSWLFGKEIDLSDIFVWKKSKLLDYIKLWKKRLEQHENDEYYDGQEYKQIKEGVSLRFLGSKTEMERIALAELWEEYFKKDNLTEDEIYELRLILSVSSYSSKESVKFNCTSEIYSKDFLNSVKKISKNETRWQRNEYLKIIRAYCDDNISSETKIKKEYKLLQFIVEYLDPKPIKVKSYYREYEASIDAAGYGFLFGSLDLFNCTDDEFKDRFSLLYRVFLEFCVKHKVNLYRGQGSINSYSVARAAKLNLISESALIEFLLYDEDEGKQVEQPSYVQQKSFRVAWAYRLAYYEEKYSWRNTVAPTFDLTNYVVNKVKLNEDQQEVIRYLRSILTKISERFLSIEKNRLIEKTAATPYMYNITLFPGVEYLETALKILEKEKIVRTRNSGSKVDVFVSVIINSYPTTDDDYKVLEAMNIPQKRLVEVGMLAPQWMPHIEKVLKWDGFMDACYYFIAHMKSYDAERKKAEIIRFTSLEPEDLLDGAFDIDWCKRVSEKLGEKNFKMLYDSAKFLCDNAFHSRARKYADACLSKLDLMELKKEAHEKRNKDSLNAYCVFPIKDDKDLLERYLTVQQFKKESKQFGSQRQASEKRCVEIALENLARNSRFETATRLIWFMESEMVKQNSVYLEPQRIEDIEMWIEFDEQGKNSVKLTKKGKAQKSIPSSLKNNEKVLEIQRLHKQWNEQYRRARVLLQEAMENRVVFLSDEFEVMMCNPIVSPMLKKLILKQKDSFGFHSQIDMNKSVQIAHPFDLYKTDVWHHYQQEIFKQAIVQPFKQVFRELYLKLDNELDNSMTERYSGYQVQTKKTAGALKSRKWVVNYESGLEKVYYKENIVVNLYMYADWFSPNDIESPSIDGVGFHDRKTYKSIPIKDIDDVIFSEVMRDVDLAVSVAYVGGVDPITSFSTVELRKTIAEFTAELMGLKNITFQEHFVNIEGVLNNYSIHLGSGMIHQSGGGAIHTVAIHNAKRGKVYLPFLDEDPRTAEIISKIVMFAEDNKLKDPSILSQIVSKNQKSE